MAENPTHPVETAENLLLKSDKPDPKKAIELLHPLVLQASTDPRVTLYYAIALSLDGRKDEAVSHAERAHKLSEYLVTQCSALLERLKK